MSRPQVLKDGKSQTLSADQSERLEFAVGHSPVVHFVADPAQGYRITFVSPNVEAVTGHKPAEILDDPGYHVRNLHPDSLLCWSSALELAEVKGAASTEYRLKTANGGYRWFRDDFKLAPEEPGRGARIVGARLDITDSRQEEDEPQLHCNVLHATLDSIPNGIALYDTEDRLALCNASFATLYEVRPSDLIGLSSSEMLRRAEKFCIRIRDWTGHERFGPRIRELQNIQAASNVQSYEMEVTDGRWFLVTAHRLADGCTTVVRTDITDHKRSESSLRDTEALKAGIIDSAMDCVIAIDEFGKIIEFNPAAERVFGCGREVAIGQAIGQLILPEELRDSDLDAIPSLFRDEKGQLPRGRIEFKAMRCDGTRFPAELTVSEVELAGRRVFAVSLRDITEQKRARKERKRLIQLLRDAIESVPNGFAIYDAYERLVLCNTAYASFYGESPESMLGVSGTAALGRALDQISSVEGQTVGEKGFSRQRAKVAVARGMERSLEVELKDGRWMLFDRHQTSDGGFVCVLTDVTPLKQAEASLRERAQYFRQIVEGQPAPVWLVDIESGKLLYQSRAAAELFGISWPIETPLNVLDFYPDPAAREPLMAKVMELGSVDNYELQLRKTDKTVFWVAATCRRLRIDGRDVVISSMLDLTERKQREAELQQARRTLEDAIGSLSEGFALYDGDDRLVMCNQRYREYNSESADMLKPGVRWADFIRAGAERGQYIPALGRVEEWIEERTAQRASHARHIHIEQSDGRWFQVSNQPTRQGGYVAIRTDITHLKQMEIALRKSEERFRRMVEEHTLPVLMTRAKDGKIIYESPAARALFGRSDETGGTNSMHHHAVGYYVDPEDREPYIAALRRHGVVENREIQFKKVDGTPFWASVSSRLIEYHGEDVIVASLVDLTERRRIEEELDRRREAMHQNEKLSALGSLLAGVAHELNNPLSVVVGQALLLRETVSDSRIAKRAAKIGDAADRCSRIVKAFLAMARHRPPERRQVDLNCLLDSVLEMLRYTMRTQNIELVVEADPVAPAAWADADQLNQVLVNLIVNAQHAVLERPEPRRIEVSTARDAENGLVRVTVADNGPGIPDEIRHRIFDPFFTTKQVGSGTGVGLAVSYSIVESHGGQIEVESGPDGGAVFTLILPAAEPRAVRAANGGESDGEVRTGRVLIVDDETEIALTLREILGIDGHEFEFAESGRAALALLRQAHYDVVLCDLRMPDLDGQGLYKELQASQPDILDRFVFVTGDTFGQTASDFFDETGLPFLEKPFTPWEVRGLVRKIIAARDAEAATPRV